MKKFKTFEASDTAADEQEPKKVEKKETPFLDTFGKDLTKLAEENKLEPVIGRDKEIFQVLWVLSRKTKNNPVIIGEPGVGKAQPLNSLILTPNGWVKMGDLKLNDEVITPDGSSSKITGIFPQGKKDIYEFEFKDGSKTKACLEHLWKVYGIPKGKKRKRGWQILSTKEIINLLENTKYKLKIQLVDESINDFNKEDLFINPYILGALLGDGGLNNGSIRFTNIDEEIINKINFLLEKNEYRLNKGKLISYNLVSKEHKIFDNAPFEKGSIQNEYYKHIIDLGLNKKSHEKFIPEIYKNSSLNTKYELIQGLMDTDGYVGKNGTLHYYTTSEQLANDVKYIINSIGGLCKINIKKTNYKYKGELKEGKLCYSLAIRYSNPEKLVNLQRKKDNISKDYQYKDNLKNQIKSVKYHSNEEAQCIMIDDPNHLYITDNFIVTHNTAIVEAIAKRIADRKCPETLEDKRIYYLDMASLSGDLEKKAKVLLKELDENRNIILFIDEIHLMINKSLPIDAANIFKPALARGEMRCIGATTLNEYRNSIEKDGALERRFQKVMVNEPSEADTIEILKRISERFEDFHKVKYDEKAIIACVKLSGRYITDRFFPDKAIDLLDEVGAKLRLSNTQDVSPEILKLEKELIEIKKEKKKLTIDQKFEEASQARQRELAKHKELLDALNKTKNKKIEVINITEDDVNNVVALKTGIPVERVSKDEGERLVGMEKELKLTIIGQDEAVTKISKFIRRSRAGLKDPKRPGGVFLFLGGTGTGKTHTVKMLAKYIFGNENDLIRIDMTEYKEKHNVSRLIGSPPGYVGYGEGGQLTEKVRRKPYSIVLLDEIEKAHPDVLNVLLQVFDDGHLTDGSGKKVDFKNTIIIMTSNIGATAAREVRTPVGFGDKKTVMEETKKDTIKQALYRHFLPEFINRIDDVVIFKELDKENVYKIIDIEISKLSDKLKEMGYTLSITTNVKDFLIENGYDQSMGARPLKRAIQTHLEDPIADEILAKKIKDKIEIDYDKEAKKLIINGNPITERKKIKNWGSFRIK